MTSTGKVLIAELFRLSQAVAGWWRLRSRPAWRCRSGVDNFGGISGAHFNPAVTAGMLVTGRITPVLTAMYVVETVKIGASGIGLTVGFDILAGGRR